MSQFETRCRHCGMALNVQEEWIGMELECPGCKNRFALQAGGAGTMPPPMTFQPNPSLQAPPRPRNLIVTILLVSVLTVLLGAGVIFSVITTIGKRTVLPDRIKDREILMLQALKLSDKQMPTDEASLNQLKEKAAKTNNPDLLLPIGLAELSIKKIDALKKGIDQGNGGCLFYLCNILDKGFGNVIEKAVECKFWPVIIKYGVNCKLVATLEDKKLSPAEEKLVALSDQYLKNGDRKLTIEGGMDAALGCFILFENKICYFSVNDKKPRNVTVDGKKWTDLSSPFFLNEKIYPCVRYHSLSGNKFEHINMLINWNESITVYPDLNSNFKASFLVIKNDKAK